MPPAAARTVSRIETAQPPQRSAPTHANRMVIPPAEFAVHSPFLMMAEDWFAPPAGFPDHPHRGMETVTLVLEGSIEHRDHTGAHGVIGPGEIQWMTAGKGVVHSEMPGPQGVHSLQLWLNLPAAQKMSTARYADQRLDAVDTLRGEGWEVRLYAGHEGDADRAHGSSYPMSLKTAALDPGARCDLTVPADERAFLYVVQGRLTAGGTSLSAGQIGWIDPAQGESLVLEAQERSFAVLCSGRPIDEPVAAYGPFVMNSMDEIRQAFDDYRGGAFV